MSKWGAGNREMEEGRRKKEEGNWKVEVGKREMGLRNCKTNTQIYK